jgi:glycerol-3-phosphate dehydrogenase
MARPSRCRSNIKRAQNGQVPYSKKHVAIVGGGINGLSCAWRLAQEGHKVVLFERDSIMNATSRTSSKLLHGGLRYLENREFRLVREALRERDRWLDLAPDFTHPLRLLLPVYKNNHRSVWQFRLGLGLYDLLAGSSVLPKSQKLSREEVLQCAPGLNRHGLIGGFLFSDGQMDDYALGLWVAEKARDQGVSIKEGAAIEKLHTRGAVSFNDGSTEEFDHAFNVAGPWAQQLLDQSCIESPYKLDLVRGSHLVFEEPCQQACLLEVPNERRIFFVLPWKGKTLVGTTEVRQKLEDPIRCSDTEREYLIAAYHHYFPQSEEAPVETFAGLRPLIYSAHDPRKATREYAIFTSNKLTTVFGGKWTTTLALADKLTKILH